MGLEKIAFVIAGLFAVILLIKAGVFSEIIKGLTDLMGPSGTLLGVLIVLILILAFFGVRR